MSRPPTTDELAQMRARVADWRGGSESEPTAEQLDEWARNSQMVQDQIERDRPIVLSLIDARKALDGAVSEHSWSVIVKRSRSQVFCCRLIAFVTGLQGRPLLWTAGDSKRKPGGLARWLDVPFWEPLIVCPECHRSWPLRREDIADLLANRGPAKLD